MYGCEGSVEDEMAARLSQVGNLEIVFKKAVENDIPELTEVMTRAFDDDSRRFRGKPAEAARQDTTQETSSGNGWALEYATG